MGTPEFAVASLKALLDGGHNVVAVVTSPDKPAGRGQKLQESDVKRFAREAGLLVLQPEKLKDPEFIGTLRELRADLHVVVAFRMLPEAVWSMPRCGTINLHGSLLPQYRGAAPINWALINGDEKTGVTTFFIEKEIDTGKIIYAQEVLITDQDNAGTLHDKLMVVGAQLLERTVRGIKLGGYPQTDQLGALPAGVALRNAPKIFKDTCKIHWDAEMDTVWNFIRGLSPYPAAWCSLANRTTGETLSVKVFDVERVAGAHGLVPGSIATDGKHYIKVAVPGGYLSIKTLQMEGKKRLGVEEFLRGFKGIEGYGFV